MSFPGGKGKIFRRLINLMPSHEVYIEPFLGSGCVLKNKLPSKRNIANDIDSKTLKSYVATPQQEVFNEDALTLLKRLPIDAKTLIYCDPPYIRSSRKRKDIYRYEFSDKQHQDLLQFLKGTDAMVMISGYQSGLYDEYLKDWNSESFSSQTHSGIAREFIWFNFEKPRRLHDSRFVGSTFRERDVFKRKKQRLEKKFREMEPVERFALLQSLNEQFL